MMGKLSHRVIFQGDRTLADVPWPMPEKWSRDNVTFTLHPSSLTFDPNSDCDVIQEAVKRYSRILNLYKEENTRGESDITKVELRIDSGTCEKYPYLDMDESCKC